MYPNDETNNCFIIGGTYGDMFIRAYYACNTMSCGAWVICRDYKGLPVLRIPPIRKEAERSGKHQSGNPSGTGRILSWAVSGR